MQVYRSWWLLVRPSATSAVKRGRRGVERKKKLGEYVSLAKRLTFAKWAIDIAATLGQLSGAVRPEASAGTRRLKEFVAAATCKERVGSLDRKNLGLWLIQELIFVHKLPQWSERSWVKPALFHSRAYLVGLLAGQSGAKGRFGEQRAPRARNDLVRRRCVPGRLGTLAPVCARCVMINSWQLS